MMQRRNYFIKKGFQANFAIRFVILILLEAALIAGLFIYISGDTLTTGYADSILKIERTTNYFMLPMILVILISVVGVGLAGMIVFIVLSHRIAGPLYRFESDLRDVGYGDLTRRINLRRSDQLTDIKEALNSMISTFDERMARLKALIMELKTLAESGEQFNSARVQTAINKLKDELDRFKVTSGPNA